MATDEQKANRRRLVGALRSGRYSQISGQLRNACGYCVMGVACDLIDRSRWKFKDDYFEFLRRDLDGIRSYSIYAPTDVLDAYGFRTTGCRTYDDESLMDMNDNGITFVELADLIEREPPGLFVD